MEKIAGFDLFSIIFLHFWNGEMEKIIFSIIFLHFGPVSYNYFLHFSVIFSPFAARRRSDFDSRIGRLIGGAREGRKFGSPGAQERACCKMAKKSEWRKIMEKNNGEKEWRKIMDKNNGEK
jgi:hypothetical protein